MLLSVCALAAGASLQPSPKPALPTRSSLLELRGGASLKQQLKEEISVKGAPPPSLETLCCRERRALFAPANPLRVLTPGRWQAPETSTPPLRGN